MRNAIIDKLKAALVSPVQKESEVVYILVEARKLLEHLSDSERFRSLKFYCNWALHIRLDRTQARALLVRVDGYFSKLFENGLTQEGHSEFTEMLYLESFRNQFRQFLQLHELPERICDSNEWFNFLNWYSRVIEDCPLVCENSGKPLKHIDKMVFIKVDRALEASVPNPDKFVPFTIRWELFFRGECIGHLDLHPNQQLLGSKLVLHSSE